MALVNLQLKRILISRMLMHQLMPSYPAIDQRMSQLKARKELLMKELKEISIAIADDKRKKEELPETISKMREEMAVRARKSLKPISGSAADDERTINEIDQIRLNAMNAIRAALEPM
jgi:hypothetical protein